MMLICMNCADESVVVRHGLAPGQKVTDKEKATLRWLFLYCGESACWDQSTSLA